MIHDPWKSPDDTVSGCVGIWPGEMIVIYEWTSHQPGKGNTVRALEQLRLIAPYVIVVDIGEPRTDSRKYWFHMKGKGLVDRFERP